MTEHPEFQHSASDWYEKNEILKYQNAKRALIIKSVPGANHYCVVTKFGVNK